MKNTIYITGAGIISAIGVGKEATLSSILEEKTGIEEMRYLDSCHHDLPVGEVKLSNIELRKLFNADNSPLLTRTAMLGRIALDEALRQSCLVGNDLSEVHLISSTTVGGMDKRELNHANEHDCDRLHAEIATHNCATCTEIIAKPFGDFASLSTVSTACSSATNSIIVGANMIRCGIADVVVAGGAECLTKFHLNGFNSLLILDHELCKPFDKNRGGLNLGEGAAYLVLENAESVNRRNIKPLCILSGYGNACDAYHQTASSPDGEGAYLAMCDALKTADLTPKDIDYVNAHGTGTPNNDKSESNAIKRVFGNIIPPVSSTKGYTGHTTSASGSIEAVISLLAIEHQFYPPNINWHTPMDGGIIPITETSNKKHKGIGHVLSNAFAFGGNDSSIILSKYDN